MKLSICIPTYHRYQFLEWTVAKLKAQFPTAQIVISDNDSNELVMPIPRTKYIKQFINIGPFPNMLEALEGADGEYAVYCADDDYLLPDQIEAGIAYLDAHPECAAYCAPCEVYDEVNQKSFRNAFKIGEPKSFDKSNVMDLFNFIVMQHIWPEHIIYRTPVPLKPRTRAYWAFADLVDILERGSIYFTDSAFYRNLVTHPVGEREQLGNIQALSYFDEYRGGLEVLAHGLFGSELPYSARHQLQEMIASFICTRMHTAARMYVGQGKTEEAVMLLQRLSIADPRRDEVKLAARNSEGRACQ